MRKSNLIPFLFYILCLNYSSKAQGILPLPYFINFEDSIQNNEWHSFETSTPSAYKPWILKNAIQNDTTFSNCIFASNDYIWAISPIQEEWMTSPALDLTAGAYVSFRAKIASPNNNGTFAYLDSNEYIGLYLLEGSPNPDSATSALEISNLGALFSGNDGENIAHPEYTTAKWRDTNNIYVPPSLNNRYIAFKYDAGSGYHTFHVYIDDLSVTQNAITSIVANKIVENVINIFPNPVSNFLEIKSIEPIQSITIFNCLGKEVMRKNIQNNSTSLFVSNFSIGVYQCKIIFTNTSIQPVIKKFSKTY